MKRQDVERRVLRTRRIVRVRPLTLLPILLFLVPALAHAALPPATFDFAVYATGTGCGAITISGNAYVDSFDSSQGSYSQTKQSAKGIVGLSGNINLSGQATINGPIFAMNTSTGNCQNGIPGITVTGGAKATGGYIQLNAAPAFPNPDPVTAGSQDYNLSANATLAPGNYRNITVSGRATLTLSPGTYNINAITLSGQSILTVNPAGLVILNVAGANVSQPIQLSGGSILNPSEKPLNFQLIYGGSLPITLSGRTSTYAVAYAPNAAATLSGASDWFGSIVVKTLVDSGGSPIHYDRSLAVPPTIVSVLSPLPNAAGWNNSNVTVNFTCADPVLGIASCTSPVAVTTEGANRSIPGTATNRAGFSATATAIVNLDKTVPTITASSSPAPNAAGWNNSDFTVNFACSDALSTIASCTPPLTISTDGSNQLITGTAVDKAGNTASASVTLKLDKTAPGLTISTPSNGSTISLSTPSISVLGTVIENGSGLVGVTCNGAAAALSASNFTCSVTLVQGANTVAIKATDVAGNSTTSNLNLTFAPAPKITINSPVNLSVTNFTPVTVNGTVNDPGATIKINGIAAPQSSGAFSIPVPLVEGLNVLTAVATNANGVTSTATAQVTLDTTPPHITIDSPADGATTTDASVTVTGIANDIVVGTVNAEDVQVTVNGIGAQVANIHPRLIKGTY